MDVEFADSRIKSLCESQPTAVRKLGNDSARKLRARLSDLFAAHQVGDLVAGKPHPLKGDRQGDFSVNLAGGDRLVFECNDDPKPILSTGHTDWPKVTSVVITYVGDYHD